MRQHLAQRIEAGCVVVTPNRRLAAHLRREYDALQLQSGKPVWPTAECLPLNAFLERTYGELTRFAAGATLLSPQQETVLWEQVIAGSQQGEALLNPAAAARAAREAWELQHAWRIDLARYRSVLNEDGAAYAAWAAQYERRCREHGWLDAARLADAIAAGLDRGELKPRALVLYGFDQVTPQSRAALYALATRGWEVTEMSPRLGAGQAVRAGYADAEAELTAVAARVRQALAAQPAARIGVIVPDLAARRADVVRIFDDVLQPARVTAASRARARPYNVSLGLPLTGYPLVAGALLILELARGELALEDLGSLLRSPFIAAAEQELTRRALLDARFRESGRLIVTLNTLARVARGRSAGDPAAAPLLDARLAAWVKLASNARKGKQPPSQWSTTFQKLLAGLGWPGERTLDSEEYQTFAKWRETVSELSALDLVAPRLGYDEALARLRRLADGTLFQPESPEVPVQVLGVLEANALEFDYLFVTGLTDEAWPEPPRPNPFLPFAVQRVLGVPHAGADWQLEFARRAASLWYACAADIRLSYPLRDGDRELKPNALLREVPESKATQTDAALYRDTIFAARALETLADFTSPRLPAGIEVAGGAAFFQNQAACPFKAFAVHRLGAVALEAGHAGLDALERGSLMHQAAFNLWRELKGHKQLLEAGERELRSAVERAVAAALGSIRRLRPDVMTEAYAALERERMARLLMRLLELEKSRAPFEVLSREEPRPVTVAGIRVATRLDRVDRLADGSRVILDYKTGKSAAIGDWLGERPDEPQLPLYAVSGGRDDVAAVAFVQLHAQGVLFKGLACAEGLLPGVSTLAAHRAAAKAHASWAELFESWRAMLENLAREYLDGRAEVAPKDYPGTCRRCDLGTLCRVRELRDRGPVTAEENDDE